MSFRPVSRALILGLGVLLCALPFTAMALSDGDVSQPDEPPAVEVPVEDTTVDITPVGDSSVDDSSAGDSSVGDSSAGDSSAGDSSSEQPPAEEPPEEPIPAVSLSAIFAPSPMDMLEDPSAPYQFASMRLEALGYSAQSIRSIWAHVGPTLNQKLLAGQFSAQQLQLMALPNSRMELMARYQAYAKKSPTLALSGVVANVNAGRDVAFYTNIQTIPNPSDPLVLVNKGNILPSNYVPTLETLGSGYGSGSMTPSAARAFRAMVTAAKADRITLTSVSAYRSYATQKSLYNKNLSTDSQSVVDTYSARPGHSEHQTGLAVDINVARTSAHFENTKEFAWLNKHCAEYGFILRYPKGKDAITGFRFEPWHYRYVGVDAAKACMGKGLTFEEYTAQLPAGDYRVPTLVRNGTALNLADSSVMLDDQYYFSAQAFAKAIGAQVEVVEGWPIITRGDRTLSLFPGHTCVLDGQVTLLDSPAAYLDGAVYLSLPDLCRLLNLTAGAVTSYFTINITG